MSSTTPSATRKSASFDRLQVENGSPWSIGRASAICLIRARWSRSNLGGRPPAYLGLSESKPSAGKLCSTSRTRSGLANVTSAILATGMPCAESSTICARRQVTTDPVPRRTMRNSRIPSSLLIGRTCTGWTIAHLLQGSQDQTRQGCAAQRPAGSPYRPPNRAKAGGRGTRTVSSGPALTEVAMTAPSLPTPAVAVEEVPASARMVQLLAGFQVSQALFVVAELDVAAALGTGSRTVPDLAAAFGAEPAALRRLLRSLGRSRSVPQRRAGWLRCDTARGHARLGCPGLPPRPGADLDEDALRAIRRPARDRAER